MAQRKMHVEEVDVSEDLVWRMVDSQMPIYRNLELTVVEPWGTDNAIWRLGVDLVVRLPRIHWAEEQVSFEAQWLGLLANYLTVALPRPVATGQPQFEYPYQWAVHSWLEGHSASLSRLNSAEQFAADIADVVCQLRTIPTNSGRPARNRARALTDYDYTTREAIDAASHLIDAKAALAIWQEGLDAGRYEGVATWVHGDLEGNCLVSDGHLSGLVDWGSACCGDPAVDVQVIWSDLFTESSRQTFLQRVDVDDATVMRSKAAAIHQACSALPYYLNTFPQIVRRSVDKLRALGVDVTVNVGDS